ncbi:LysR substrate-binding domain-containing protein [Endozoicomonas sp. ALD040]|uniref:LysR substrate-binding domain-containing protein n=1 Tax=unclassified Endozoicomonas TaxID=2644528 RepID=UPI003BB216A4
MRITLRQLEIFKAIAQSGRVTAAAESLFISQPAASMALSELEKHLGPLFDRHAGASMALNDSGRSLLPMAAELIDRAHEIETQFIEDSCYKEGTLKIHASSTIGNNLMPRILGRFFKEFPHIRAELAVENTRSIQQRILAMEIDLGVVEGSCLHPEIEVIPWREDELVIICHPDHPMAGKTVDLQSLKHEEWILREPGSGTRELFDEVLATRLCTPNVIMSLNRAEAVKQAVMEGLGIGCISNLAIWRARNAGLLSTINVSDLTLNRHFYLLLNRKKYRSGVIKKVSEFILQWDDELLVH